MIELQLTVRCHDTRPSIIQHQETTSQTTNDLGLTEACLANVFVRQDGIVKDGTKICTNPSVIATTSSLPHLNRIGNGPRARETLYAGSDYCGMWPSG